MIAKLLSFLKPTRPTLWRERLETVRTKVAGSAGAQDRYVADHYGLSGFDELERLAAAERAEFELASEKQRQKSADEAERAALKLADDAARAAQEERRRSSLIREIDLAESQRRNLIDYLSGEADIVSDASQSLVDAIDGLSRDANDVAASGRADHCIGLLVNQPILSAAYRSALKNVEDRLAKLRSELGGLK